MSGPKPMVPCDLHLVVDGRRKEFEVTENIDGFTYVFTQFYLPLKLSWLQSFVRKYQVFRVDGINYYIVKSVFKNNGKDFYAHGASFDEKNASDASCYRLSLRIKKEYPGFLMPCYVIGYPNLRGHCALSSAVIPLFHIWPLVCNVFDKFIEFQRLFHLGRFSASSYSREEPEVPFYWTDSFGRMLRTYRSMAVDGVLPLHNCAFMSKYKLKLKDFQDFPHIRDHAIRPYNDLVLDRSLVYGLASSLGKYCNSLFKTPKGDERIAYQYLMKKLASEIPNFADNFSLSIKCGYYCESCSGGPFVSVYHLPVITIPFGSCFQDLINNPHHLASVQGLTSRHVVNNLTCTDAIRCLNSAEILTAPKFLCFGVDNDDAKGRIMSIPDKITMKTNDREMVYHRFANSVCFRVYKNVVGDYLGSYFHIPTESDIPVGEHSYLVIRTRNRYVEVNNGLLYEPDARIFPYALPCTLHFFLAAEFLTYLPLVNEDKVLKHPRN